MDNDKLKLMAQAVMQMESATGIFKQALYDLLGASEAEKIFESVSNSQSPPPLQNENTGGLTKQKSVEEIIKEVKQMIAELNIKASVREHRNGLLKFTSSSIGCTVYGRTREEIEAKVKEHIREFDKNKGKKVKATKVIPLLSVFYRENYLPYKKAKGRAENTVLNYEQHIKFIQKKKFDLPLTQYTPQIIEKFLYSFSETRKRQMIQGFLNNVFERAVMLQLIKTNPCAPIEKAEHKQEQGTAFSFDEQLEFVQILIDSQRLSFNEKCYLLFVLLTGARRSEALSVCVADADFKNKVLAIHGTKTDGSDRHIPLTPLVEKLLLSMNMKKGKYFKLTENQTDKLFREAWDKKKGHKLHDLRHTFGTIQICVKKVDVKTVSLWLGHSTVDTTLRIYTHPEQLDRGTFVRGDLTEAEKIAIYREKYNKVLRLIEKFITEQKA